MKMDNGYPSVRGQTSDLLNCSNSSRLKRLKIRLSCLILTSQLIEGASFPFTANFGERCGIFEAEMNGKLFCETQLLNDIATLSLRHSPYRADETTCLVFMNPYTTRSAWDDDLAPKLGVPGGGSADINPALKVHHCI